MQGCGFRAHHVLTPWSAPSSCDASVRQGRLRVLGESINPRGGCIDLLLQSVLTSLGSPLNLS
jgi:hypothetical protein